MGGCCGISRKSCGGQRHSPRRLWRWQEVTAMTRWCRCRCLTQPAQDTQGYSLEPWPGIRMVANPKGEERENTKDCYKSKRESIWGKNISNSIIWKCHPTQPWIRYLLMTPQLLSKATVYNIYPIKILSYDKNNYEATLRGTCGHDCGTSQFPRQRKAQ